jgi:hypothetical protein
MPPESSSKSIKQNFPSTQTSTLKHNKQNIKTIIYEETSKHGAQVVSI